MMVHCGACKSTYREDIKNKFTVCRICGHDVIKSINEGSVNLPPLPFEKNNIKYPIRNYLSRSFIIRIIMFVVSFYFINELTNSSYFHETFDTNDFSTLKIFSLLFLGFLYFEKPRRILFDGLGYKLKDRK